ncbi:alpha/beta fold hydrolase [Micromonospora sp. HUAS LYJ1]|uniref:alpha/beta fold hydrolase n=1 Tax=Micromonospora sp. HUAS LYJ1 TaxID=3061626 RepID=UPI0026727156|nr:alpha/beta hydrolase [Micromonospora sp. HUAS LYJ1]WKU07075.1 alpha/beta hydrolase [Micromonospora sp. HUAS LYJ1]
MTDERIVLVGGLWLDAPVWDGVVAELARRGRHAVAVRLPGQGDGNTTATLDDQVGAVLAAVDAAPGGSVVVGHSAACALAWLAADARPSTVGRVVLIGGFPPADGDSYADFFPIEDGVMPFPGWVPFEGPDAADLDDRARREFAAAAVPVPEQVARGTVRLTDTRRYEVPVVLVCPEFSPAQARAMIDAGDLPELAKARQVDLVDIDSGHWPMLSRPVELAGILAGL